MMNNKRGPKVKVVKELAKEGRMWILKLACDHTVSRPVKTRKHGFSDVSGDDACPTWVYCEKCI